MAGFLFEIVGDTGHLRLHSPPNIISDGWYLLSGSFNPSPDERRVITMFLANDAFPDHILRLRFEFTDPTLATMDTTGQPVYLTSEDRITPYREIKGKSPVDAQKEL
jgi:hypothetical protein